MAKQAIISKKVRDEVAHLMVDGGDFMRNAKAFTRSVNRDRKLNKFLEGDFEQGLKAITDVDFREKIMTSLNHITDVQGKQALVISMLDAEIDSIVADKVADVTKGLVLNQDEKAMVAERAVKFGAFIKGKIKPGILDWAKTLGAVEYVEEQVAVAQP